MTSSLNTAPDEKDAEILVSNYTIGSELDRFKMRTNMNYGSVDDLRLNSRDGADSAALNEKNIEGEIIASQGDDEGVSPAIVFPEGGTKAWLCVVGAFCTQFCSFGWVNTFGIFQDYYLRNQLYGYSPTTVSWIASLQSSIMFMGCLVTFFFNVMS